MPYDGRAPMSLKPGLIRLLVAPVAVLSAVIGMAALACGGGGDPARSAATRFDVAGRQEAFDRTELTASAGTIAIVFRNEESILHNVRVFEGTDANGRLVKKTPVKRGPRSDTLKVALAPGTYFYDCEIHPQTMRGTIRVS